MELNDYLVPFFVPLENRYTFSETIQKDFKLTLKQVTMKKLNIFCKPPNSFISKYKLFIYGALVYLTQKIVMVFKVTTY